MRIEDISGWFVGESYSRRWLILNEGKLKIYLQRYHPAERFHLIYEMLNKASLLAMQAVQDCFLEEEEKWAKITEDILGAEGLVILMSGGKRKGKTASCWSILEKCNAAGKNCVLAGPPQVMPKWCKRVMDPADAPTDCIIYITEAAIQYSARTSMSPHQRDALSILPTIAHSGRVVIAEAQHTRLIDVNFIRLADRFILKPAPLVGEERSAIKDFARYVKPKTIKEMLYFAGDWFTMLTEMRTPECWKVGDLSHPYKAIKDEMEAITYGEDLWNLGYSLTDIRRALVARSFMKELWWWREKLKHLIFAEMPPPENPTVPAIDQAITDVTIEGGQEITPIERRRPPTRPIDYGNQKYEIYDE